MVASLAEHRKLKKSFRSDGIRTLQASKESTAEVHAQQVQSARQVSSLTHERRVVHNKFQAGEPTTPFAGSHKIYEFGNTGKVDPHWTRIGAPQMNTNDGSREVVLQPKDRKHSRPDSGSQFIRDQCFSWKRHTTVPECFFRKRNFPTHYSNADDKIQPKPIPANRRKDA